MTTREFLALCVAAFVLLGIVVRRFREIGRDRPLTVEAEHARDRAVVGYLPQHNPGVSVGDWPDEYAVDPAYDAMEAIRPHV